MKKSIIRKIALVATVVLMAFGLGACGGSMDGPYSGEWTSTTMDLLGSETSVSEMLGSDIVIKITDDGKAKFEADGKSDGMKWEEKSEGVIVLKHSEMDMEMTIDGDKAVLDFMGYDINMER